MEDLTILICTHGGEEWDTLARQRAYPSASGQGAQIVICYEPEMTLAQVRNHAATLATTEWLCFLDADDELDFGYVDAMSRVVDGEDALLAPAVKYIDPRRRTAPAAIPNAGNDMKRMNSCVVGTLIRRSTFVQHGGFQEWPIYEDWDLFLGVHLSGVPIVYVPDAVYKAHVSSVSRNKPGHRRVAARTYHQIRVKHGLTR